MKDSNLNTKMKLNRNLTTYSSYSSYTV